MKTKLLMATVLLTACASTAFAAGPQAAGTAQKRTFASEFNRQLTDTEKEVVPAAEAMPEDKFNFAPTQGDFKGVRTFALQVKHIAVANYALGAGILGEKPPVPLANENGPANLTSKADVVKFLKDSFEYAHKALNSVNENNLLEPIKSPFGNNETTRLALATEILAHPWDHYGQMVEYLRMNNIIPPASRG